MLGIISLSLLFASCEQKASNEDIKIEMNDIFGIWRIDSTSENGKYNKRNAIYEEFFIFKEDGTVDVKSNQIKGPKLVTLGTFELISDTLKINTLKGNPGMTFIINLNGKVMRLDGTFPISVYNDRKPTMFLGKTK